MRKLCTLLFSAGLLLSGVARAARGAQLAALVLHLTLFALGAGAAFVLGLR